MDRALSRREQNKVTTRQALTEAALRLFGARGFGAVTMEEVAAAAGVAPRTAFRYFPDKAELIFSDDSRVDQMLDRALAERPSEEGNFVAVRAALLSLAPLWADRHEAGRVRQMIIDGSPVLQARAMTKLAAHQSLIVEGLLRRGSAHSDARLAARVAVSIFDEGVRAWLAEEEPPSLDAALREMFSCVTVRDAEPSTRG